MTVKSYVATIVLTAALALPLALGAQNRPSDSSASSGARPGAAPPAPFDAADQSLGGNLPKVLEARPYLVTSDIYIPSGKTVKIEPGAVLLFKNFTGLHVEGKLIAEGSGERPIVFTSEFDHTYNPRAALHANPYDWNGIYLHESGLGSTMAHCKILYSVYGISSLTKYIRIDNVFFVNNGRSDLTIEGRQYAVAAAKPYSYALSISDARKDGVPVKILMDPSAKKRSAFRYGGLSLLAGGITMGIWNGVQASRDQKRLNDLSDKQVISPASNIVANASSDWTKAKQNRDRDIAVSVGGLSLAVLGGCGFSFSFIF